MISVMMSAAPASAMADPVSRPRRTAPGTVFSSSIASPSAAIQATLFNPETALDAGFLDEIVTGEELLQRSIEAATQLAQYPAQSYAGNKLAIREASIERIRQSLVAAGT